MDRSTNRIQPRLQVLSVSAMGWKFSQRLQICYRSGVARTLPVRLANHINFPAAGVYPLPTGRVTFAVADMYWQGERLQITEVRNANPSGLTPWDGATDSSVWNDLHGYKCENLPAGASRDFLVRVNGADLTFDDVRELIELIYPSPA